MQAVGASRKVFELIDRKPKFENNGYIAPDGKNAKIEGRIEFRNVQFSYPTRPELPILQVCYTKIFNFKLYIFLRTLALLLIQVR